MRRVLAKALFISAFVLMGAASVTVAAIAMGFGQQAPPIKDRVIIEAGLPMPSVSDFFLPGAMPQNAAFVTDMSIFSEQNPILGEFTVEISYNRNIFTSSLHIVDTIPPRGTIVNRLTVRGEEIPPESFAQDIRDATLVTVSFYQPIDFYSPGEQLVWLALRDQGGNETVIAGHVYILDGVRTVYREYGYEPEPVTVEDFLFNEAERMHASFITDVDEMDFTQPGVYPLEMWVMGRAFTFYVNVSDTQPPLATPIDARTYVNMPIPAEYFVTDIFDRSPFEIYFYGEPDFGRAGQSTVTVTVRDVFDNAIFVESTLDVVYDTAPPVFTGLRTRYVVQGGTVAFRPGVTAIDGRDGEVGFTVDTAGLDTSILGEHYVYYEAIDISGNLAREAVRVVVTEIDPEEVYALAQGILDNIITEDMTMYQQARAIYSWVKRNISYVASGPQDNIINGAHNGFVNRRGDCYTFFAASALMMDMLDIPNITMVRVGGRNNHWWSIIDVGEGWHHFDATPHMDGRSGFHFTETRARELTAARGARNNYYVFDPEALPEGVVIIE